MNITVNWNLNRSNSGTVIDTNGRIYGSGPNILLNILRDIDLTLAAKTNIDSSRYLKVTDSQRNSLRIVLSQFNVTSVSSEHSELEELAIALYSAIRP